MHKEQLLKVLRELGLPRDGYVIFGGACLAIRDLRATDDIDLFVSKEVYEELKGRGWQERTDLWEQPWLQTEINGIIIEVYQHFEAEGWQPRFEHYLTEPEMVGGYRFMPLDELYEWKAFVRRPKDVADMKLIEQYRQN